MSVYQVKVKSLSLYPERNKCETEQTIIRVFLKLQVRNEAQWVLDGREEISDTITGKSTDIIRNFPLLTFFYAGYMVYVGEDTGKGLAFYLQRYVDGFENKIDKSQTLEMLIKQLEYDPQDTPYTIKIITGDDEKYEIEPVDTVGDVTEMMETVACSGQITIDR